MKPAIFSMILGGASVAVVVGTVNARPGMPGSDGGTASGPDVIVGAINDVAKWGAVTNGATTIMAYSFGTSDCNIGAANLAESVSGITANQHSVVAQNLYRVKNQRVEQIGASWVKHSFCALQQNLCGTCQPAGSGCPPALGVGCSDSTTGTSSGTQSNLGPRSQVNASTGAFPYPVTGVPAAAATVGRRCQVNANDLDPALNAGATYFVECMYVNPTDALAGNGQNNASYRQAVVGPLSNGAYTLTYSGGTAQQKCAIDAWKQVNPDVQVSQVNTPDGRLVVGCLATDNGNGTWHYEYAVFNMSSDLAVRAVTVPVASPIAVTNQGFHDIDYHSGDPYATLDWFMSTAGNLVTWNTEPMTIDPNANALRWGTTYNFRFDADAPPAAGSMTLGMFKSAATVDVAVLVPVRVPLGDLNGDGIVDGADLGTLLGQWGRCSGCDADLNEDGKVDGADLGILLGDWHP